jgi:hypothetical protein
MHSLGYESVVPDTLPIIKAAKALYIGFGFKKMEPYYDNPLEGIKYYRRVRRELRSKLTTLDELNKSLVQ